MPVVLGIAAIGSIAAQGYGMVQKNKAAKASAALATSTAEYNAQVDLADAKQIEMDAEANLLAARREAAIYTSRQTAAYAASGVLNTGSALAVQAETASRLEQQALQERNNMRRETTKRESAARLGVLYGQKESAAIKSQNRLDMLNGGIGILKTVAGAYTSGMFSKTPNPSATTAYAGQPS